MASIWKCWTLGRSETIFKCQCTHRFLTLLCNAARKSGRPSSVRQEIRQTGGSPETRPSSLSSFCLWTWGNRSVLFSTRRTLPIKTWVEQWGKRACPGILRYQFRFAVTPKAHSLQYSRCIDAFAIPVSGCSWSERTLFRWRLRNSAASGALEGRWAQSTTTRVKSACSNLKEKNDQIHIKTHRAIVTACERERANTPNWLHYSNFSVCLLTKKQNTSCISFRWDLSKTPLRAEMSWEALQPEW